tara:strand:+ start:153 stop:1253 length:1101 start_codon:yes stop_codon:yes gene_type:complete
MGFKTGIVGMPNVGKSTLFNALTRTATAQAANFPFCTIDPNVGDVSVPDERLTKLAQIVHSKQVIPARMSFVDIAGLVKGASNGEGLGNQFLANIRECDAIAHVLRCFESDDVSHVEGRVDPENDMEIIETELMLADLQTVEKRLNNLIRKLKSSDKDATEQAHLLEMAKDALSKGNPARSLNIEKDQTKSFRELGLLTSKPVLYVCNVDERSASKGNKHSLKVENIASTNGSLSINISASIEQEISQLTDMDEVKLFLEEMDLREPGLERLIKAGYKLLGLQTYFTAGPKETRAWTISANTLAPQAAGKIHGDFEKGFIRAEAISFEDFIEFNGEQGARETGKLRSEGKNYIVQDGDVLNFLFNN